MAAILLTIRFLTELAGLAAVAYAGFQVTAPLPMPVHVVTGVAAAIGFAVLWGLVAAPRTDNGLSQPVKTVIGSGLLLLAAASLAVAGRPDLAAVLAVVVIVDNAVLSVLGADAQDAFGPRPS